MARAIRNPFKYVGHRQLTTLLKVRDAVGDLVEQVQATGEVTRPISEQEKDKLEKALEPEGAIEKLPSDCISLLRALAKLDGIAFSPEVTTRLESAFNSRMLRPLGEHRRVNRPESPAADTALLKGDEEYQAAREGLDYHESLNMHVEMGTSTLPQERVEALILDLQSDLVWALGRATDPHRKKKEGRLTTPAASEEQGPIPDPPLLRRVARGASLSLAGMSISASIVAAQQMMDIGILNVGEQFELLESHFYTLVGLAGVLTSIGSIYRQAYREAGTSMDARGGLRSLRTDHRAQRQIFIDSRASHGDCSPSAART